jgi:hypothetical protein
MTKSKKGIEVAMPKKEINYPPGAAVWSEECHGIGTRPNPHSIKIPSAMAKRSKRVAIFGEIAPCDSVFS